MPGRNAWTLTPRPNRYQPQVLETALSAGLGYTHFREDSPLYGRRLSEDPAGYVDGVNLYAYCSNDPVNAVGRQAWR